MAQIPFLGPTYEGRSTNANASRCINFYMEATGTQDDKTIYTMVGTPGTVTLARIPTTDDPVRGIYSFNDTLFAVVGDELYTIADNGTYTKKADLLTSEGRVSFADNGLAANGVGGDQMMFVDGTAGYVWNIGTSALTTVVSSSTPTFPATPKQVAYLDGYFVVIDGTMRFVVSDLFDGTTYGGLATAAVSTLPDNVQSVITFNNQLFFIKNNSSEAWYNAAIPTADGCPFARMNGGVYDYGTPSPWSVARGGNTIFFVSSTRTNSGGSFLNVVQVVGYQPTPISTTPIAYKISQSTDLSSLFGYCYSDQGHMFYVLTNPTDDWTLVYDAVTMMWHERSSFDDGVTQKRHLSNCYVTHKTKHVVGDYRNPIIAEMSHEYTTDSGMYIHSIRTAQHIFDPTELNPVFISRLDIDAETGVGSAEPIILTVLYLADGTWLANGAITAGGILQSTVEPKAYLSWSNDGGKTWSAEYPSSMGAANEYTARLVWRRLGYSRSRVFKLHIYDQTKRVILGAYARASV